MRGLLISQYINNISTKCQYISLPLPALLIDQSSSYHVSKKIYLNQDIRQTESLIRQNL